MTDAVAFFGADGSPASRYALQPDRPRPPRGVYLATLRNQFLLGHRGPRVELQNVEAVAHDEFNIVRWADLAHPLWLGRPIPTVSVVLLVLDMRESATASDQAEDERAATGPHGGEGGGRRRAGGPHHAGTLGTRGSGGGRPGHGHGAEAEAGVAAPAGAGGAASGVPATVGATLPASGGGHGPTAGATGAASPPSIPLPMPTLTGAQAGVPGGSGGPGRRGRERHHGSAHVTAAGWAGARSV